jgi:peptidoglycan/LPS O-acetylase OafA/YrhL
MSSGIPAIEAESPVTSTPDMGRPISFRFVPALDGVRAVAVLGVMLYHGGAPLVGGGFMGVNMFFVLSGFLITSLLLGEWAKHMAIRLGQFWARRARRLLPALLVMLLGVAIYAKVFATPGEFANLRLDSLSTLFYVANWHFIFSGSSYFVQTSQPSPLEHMWSLSIEEQFYIVWPPVALFMLHLGRKLRPSRRLWPIFATAVIGALASAADMRFSFFHHASVTRLYEGTDTRCQDILVGASLAIGMAMWAQHRRPETQRSLRRRSVAPRPRFGADLAPMAAWEIGSPAIRIFLQVMGWSALAGALYLWTRVTTSQPPPFLFEGGYLLFALAVATVIFCIVTAQRAALSVALGNPVFRYIGKISYGTYLWHVPLFDLLDAARVHLYGLPLLVVRIGATLVVATASFYLVEQPIRRGRMRSITEWKAWLMTSTAFLGVVAVTVATTLPGPGTAGAAAAIPAPDGSQYAGPAVGVTMFGDSLAFTAGWAIATNNTQDPYDVRFHSEGLLGCGVMIVSDQISGGTEYPATVPCSSSSPPSKQWPALWAGLLDTQRPNVTMLMAGRWEVSDQVIDGRIVHIGEPGYDALLEADVAEAVRVGTSTGAYMMLLTAPCFSSGEQPNGQPWPEDSTTRRLEYDRILDEVAAAHPRNVEVFDFGAEVCPGGHFESTVDGVRIRLSDGVHFPYQLSNGPVAPTAKWLAWKLFPEAVRVGRLQMAGAPLR